MSQQMNDKTRFSDKTEPNVLLQEGIMKKKKKILNKTSTQKDEQIYCDIFLVLFAH